MILILAFIDMKYDIDFIFLRFSRRPTAQYFPNRVPRIQGSTSYLLLLGLVIFIKASTDIFTIL